MRPIWESSDAPRANRRDIILPNYAADGFWKFCARLSRTLHRRRCQEPQGRSRNRKRFKLANYLKPHGTGMFGIIATRSGASSTCHHNIAEQWTLYGKLIVLLSDDDIERMLLAAGSAGKPEDVIGRSSRGSGSRCSDRNPRAQAIAETGGTAPRAPRDSPPPGGRLRRKRHCPALSPRRRRALCADRRASRD